MMIRRRTMFRRIAPAALLLLGTTLAPLPSAFAQPGPDDPAPVQPVPPKAASQPRIEVVFVLDTTGSMSGLIQSAKDKIWSIANALAVAEPAPHIRMGLVAFRDRGDEYVTKRFDLSDDLDMMYRELMGFTADGGGDGPESVNQGLREAVELMPWSEDAETYKVIFLVGDAPPHMDYENDVKYAATCEAGVKKNIVFNTIQCGSEAETTPIWQEIARLGEGNMFTVSQDGGAKVIATPFDEDLAKAAKDVDATRLWWGSAEKQAAQKARDAATDDIYRGSSSSAQAARAEYNNSEAGGRNWIGSANELIHDLADGKLKLADIKDEELPENMRKMTAEEREAFVKEKAAEREALQKQIDELSKKRAAFIAAEQAKQSAGKPTWESAVFGSMKDQAARLGIKLEKAQPKAPTDGDGK
ncbi:MAG: VWA domain-containing protein [Planctomycetota bacterium]